jgi:hypothetical protein
MDLKNWLSKQQKLYSNQTLTENTPIISIHPVSGVWQDSRYMKSKFWWGGGASQEACNQIQVANQAELTQVAVLTFGPVQTFLGGGQRLRDWAVASWLCHYLSAILIFKWEEYGGKVLLPLHNSSDLLKWLQGSDLVNEERFWQAELPNVITGLHPNKANWLENLQLVVNQEWGRFLESLEQEVIKKYPKLLNGEGWRVIHHDHEYFWSVYAKSGQLKLDSLAEDIDNLHQYIESQKIGRKWQGTWWGGITSPSDGCLSIWHPGLRLITQGGTWGLPDSQIKEWWEKKATEKTRLSGLFSSRDRLNSIELVKRLASVPEIIEPTLKRLWGKTPPPCPWTTFPDRTAVAAAWVTTETHASGNWNQQIQQLEKDYFSEAPKKSKWGMPLADRCGLFNHPHALERRNIEDKELVEIWEEDVPKGWESTIEWTVGWRGDGDNMGKWLSGKHYKTLKLLWSKWHPTAETSAKYDLEITPLIVPANSPREIELPHILDLSVLFSFWNQLLYSLTEKHHHGKVIFAGGDDFLLLGPLTEAITLTSNLHQLWTGESTPLTQPLQPFADGWVRYEDKDIYPVPGKQMNFSLGVVIAQRRIPQSLWHRGLNQAYKEAKNQGRNRVCIRVLFNSGQSLEWLCPWPLWNLLMPIEPITQDQTDLNRWEKLLFYLETSRLRDVSIFTVGELIETLWASVGIPLTWGQVLTHRQEFEKEIQDWQWWIKWISLKAFLTRQQRERQKWLEKIRGEQ